MPPPHAHVGSSPVFVLVGCLGFWAFCFFADFLFAPSLWPELFIDERSTERLFPFLFVPEESSLWFDR